MISQYFNSGNFNKWEEFVNVTLPSINKTIRNEIIPQVDECLISMLGDRSNIEKSIINVRPSIADNALVGVYLNLQYVVEDWKVEEEKKKAIEADENTLREYLQTEGKTLQQLSIDTSTGNLNMQYFIEV